MNLREKETYLIGGLGITGRAVLDYLLNQDVSCVAFEDLSKENYQKAIEIYKDKPVKFYFGELPQSVFETCREVFISPGVPLTRPWVQEAIKREIPVSSELELAFRYLKGDVIAVTGTNGKSTTVSLLQEILDTGGIQSSLRGNIGTPLITAVSDPPPGIIMSWKSVVFSWKLFIDFIQNFPLF